MLFMFKWKTGDTVALYEGENLLNKKMELIYKCRHQNNAIASWFQGLKMTSFLKKPLYCNFTVTVD